MFDFFPVSAKEFDGPVLVTGAGGCIGSWALALLEHAGVEVHAFDLQIDKRRPGMLMDDAALGRVVWHAGDIADTQAVKAVVKKSGAQAIIHLAALPTLWLGHWSMWWVRSMCLKLPRPMGFKD